MKRIAVMGARGFVGRNLVEHLNGRYEVHPITRDQFNLLDEKAVKGFFESLEIDVVIHCANQGGSRKTAYDQENTDVIGNNLRMFFNLERCMTPRMKLISFGSGAQYDKARDLMKVSEESVGESIPKDDYGFSKYVISKYIGKCRQIYNPIIFGLFGKYEDYSFKFISNAILKNILHMPIEIHRNVVFDYLYINDFLKIIELVVENDFEHKEFNITPNDSIDLVTIAKYINQYSHYQSEIVVKNAGLNFQYSGSNKRLLNNVGPFSFTPYQDCISDLYQYYLENLGNINTDLVRLDQYSKNCK